MLSLEVLLFQTSRDNVQPLMSREAASVAVCVRACILRVCVGEREKRKMYRGRGVTTTKEKTPNPHRHTHILHTHIP